MIANANHVIRRQLLAAAHLAFSVDRYLLGSKELFGLGAALDHPGQLQQLAERDRRAFDSDAALDRSNLPTHSAWTR
jgi:hypothetical protein